MVRYTHEQDYIIQQKEHQRDAPTIEAALKNLETQLGISIELGRGTFTDENVTFKLNLSTINDAGDVMTREASEFQLLATMYGLRPENLFQTFTHRDGDQYKIVGMKSRSPKFPILVKRMKDNQKFKFSERAFVGVTLQ